MARGKPPQMRGIHPFLHFTFVTFIKAKRRKKVDNVGQERMNERREEEKAPMSH